MTIVIQPTYDDLVAIADQVWSSFLDPEGLNPLLPDDGEQLAIEVSASISVTGAWQGHVVLNCSSEASKNAAAALLGIDNEEVTSDDIADALGELANIVGGNVKSLLPEPCALSLPQVLIGRLDKRHWPATTELCQFRARWIDEPVSISVLESIESLEGAMPA